MPNLKKFSQVVPEILWLDKNIAALLADLSMRSMIKPFLAKIKRKTTTCLIKNYKSCKRKDAQIPPLLNIPSNAALNYKLKRTSGYRGPWQLIPED